MFNPVTDKKAAVFLADGFEEIEALTVTDILFRAGVPTVTVSIKDTPIVISSHDVTIVADMIIGDLDFDQYDILILPGGMPGTTNLNNCQLLKDNILKFNEEGKQLAAICAAPTVFAGLGLLNGKKATCHPSREEDLKAAGADMQYDSVVVEGNITTSRGMGTAIDFALEIAAHFAGQQTADQIAASIVYGC